MEGANAMAFRPLTAEPRANVNAGYMSGDWSALTAATAMTSSKISQPAESKPGTPSAPRRRCLASSICFTQIHLPAA